MHLIKINNVYHTKEKKIYNKSTVVPNLFIGHDTSIYTGRKWKLKRVNRWIVGFKFGEFAWTRKPAKFKAKQLKKKRKKSQ